MWGYLLAAAGLVMAGLVGFWGWLESALPYWAISMLFLASLCLLLIAFNFGVDAVRKITANRIDHGAAADDLISLSDEMVRAINDYVRERALRQSGTNTDDADPHAAWQRSVLEGNLLVMYIGEKFGRRIMAAVIVLKRLEIHLPFHLSHISQHNVMGTASFFGAVGQLIKSGNLSVAQKMDDQTDWDISNLIR
ncbi:hypothetical protein VQ045_06295 [Aurantimonas sp. E1-2-R+4]|uniref:hypothetical protein n=1 Tax=Aurantimonas sp. E1-2-R+4 TaxID=3113714 RepID=UPI002F939B6C